MRSPTELLFGSRGKNHRRRTDCAMNERCCSRDNACDQRPTNELQCSAPASDVDRRAPETMGRCPWIFKNYFGRGLLGRRFSHGFIKSSRRNSNWLPGPRRCSSPVRTTSGYRRHNNTVTPANRPVQNNPARWPETWVICVSTKNWYLLENLNFPFVLNQSSEQCSASSYFSNTPLAPLTYTRARVKKR